MANTAHTQGNIEIYSLTLTIVVMFPSRHDTAYCVKNMGNNWDVVIPQNMNFLRIR
jgi:hypothetical protein